ncbi:AMP-dependent synthetase and ligase (plasmid) [Cupriavidus necator]|uniref:AMP-binding protein n=1 Tax=Cupriavidus necator TaxID=106590 RepID=UPI003F731315
MHTDMQDWTVGHMLGIQAQAQGGRTFLQVAGEGRHSFEQVWLAARRVAGALRTQGVQKGDTVAIMLGNGIEAIEAWFGANLLGAVDVTLNTGYHGGSLEHALNQAAARHLVVGAEFLDRVLASESRLQHLTTIWVVGASGKARQPARLKVQDYAVAVAAGDPELVLPPVTPRDIASVIYTSGTSGPAKGVMMPHGQVVLLARQTAEKLGITADDIYYSFHPLYHMAGKFMQLLACLAAGARLVLDKSFSAQEWLPRVRESRATLSGAHGPMLEMIHAQPASPQDRDHQLRAICSAPFPRHIAAAFEQRFGLRGVEVWGMTEVGIPVWSSLGEPLREGSCGKVDERWFEFAVLDPETDAHVATGQLGEFAVRPRQPWTLMQGYMGMPEKSVQAWRNLWFHTGDLGYVDDDGYVYFVDRASDRIRRRAENISAYEIEMAALQHPAVAEAVAVGAPSEFAGDDDIRLCLVLKAKQLEKPEELLKHLANLLPHFMVPRYIEFLSEFPRSVTHKVQRAVLKCRPLNLPEVWDRKAHGVVLRQITKKI